MRHLIILSGNSRKNQRWGEAAAEHYQSKFDSCYLSEYDHWLSGEPNLDFAVEESKLKLHVQSLAAGTKITILAKSAGSLLTFLAIHHGAIRPQRCIFFGIPFDLAAEGIFKDRWAAVDDFSIEALAFHNVADPTAGYEFTRSILERHTPGIKLIATHEMDHWYGDFATYDKYLVPFIQD